MNTAAFFATLPLMAQGMLGIFAVMIALALVIHLLNRLH